MFFNVRARFFLKAFNFFVAYFTLWQAGEDQWGTRSIYFSVSLEKLLHKVLVYVLVFLLPVVADGRCQFGRGHG